jgi:threonine dehydratase
MGAGGGAPLPNERFFRIAFPEKPGALRRFLETVSAKWNISLFHYRSTGELIGGVFLGVAPMVDGEVDAFKDLIVSELGWQVDDVTADETCDLL